MPWDTPSASIVLYSCSVCAVIGLLIEQSGQLLIVCPLLARHGFMRQREAAYDIRLQSTQNGAH
jgi:hypothetical protein